MEEEEYNKRGRERSDVNKARSLRRLALSDFEYTAGGLIHDHA